MEQGKGKSERIREYWKETLHHGSGRGIWKMFDKPKEKLFLKRILSEVASRFQSTVRASKIRTGKTDKMLTPIEIDLEKVP
jgi:hypothetical protein